MYTLDDMKKWVASVRDGADAYPDAQYLDSDDGYGGECLYFKGVVRNGPDNEGCIIGQFVVPLWRDDDIDWLHSQENAWGGYGLDAVLDDVDQLDIRFDTDNNEEYEAFTILRDWLVAVQQNQDTGHKWGEAVRKADIATFEAYGVEMEKEFK